MPVCIYIAKLWQHFKAVKSTFHICSLLILVLLGRYDLDDCQIVCDNCNHQYDNRLLSVVAAGYWPGNVSREFNYLFSQELLEYFDCLHKFIPSLSIGGFLRTLEKLSADNARVRTYDVCI